MGTASTRFPRDDQESYADASAVPRELWDCVIIDAVQDVLSRANETHTRRAIVAAACAAVAEIAPKVFTESAANNEIAFPMCHVTCRLETLASGQWGVMLNSPSVNESEQAEDDDIADCMLQSVEGTVLRYKERTTVYSPPNTAECTTRKLARKCTRRYTQPSCACEC